MNIESLQQEEQQLVVFDLATEGYGIDIGAVREIIRVQDITKLPGVPAFVEGVINLRSKVIPVIDLRKRFALPVADESHDNRIVVVDIGSQDIGVVVDAVTEVLSIAPDSFEPPTQAITGSDSDYLLGLAKLDGRMIILVDLEKVISKSEQQSLTDLPSVTSQTPDTSAPAQAAEAPKASGGLNVELLEQSFAELAPRGEDFVSAFYERLFSKHPEAQPLFANSDMAEQKKKLLGALVLVINNLRKPDVLGPALQGLGKRHQEVGALPEHYPLVGAVLLETMADFLGSKWTPELKTAWSDAYAAVVAGMGVQ